MDNKIANKTKLITVLFWSVFPLLLICAAICAVLSPSHLSSEIANAHITPHSVSFIGYGNADTAQRQSYTLINKISANDDRLYLNPTDTKKVTVDIFPSKALNRDLQWSTSNENVATVDENGIITAVSPGYAKIKITSDTGVETSVSVSVYNKCAESHIINVPLIPQGEEFINGCESVSAVMALNFAGIEIDTQTFIDKYLDWRYLDRDETDPTLRYGYSPWKIYNGYPCDESGSYCYSPVIIAAIKKFVSPYYYRVDELYGKPLMQLCSDYITKDIPVVVWVTEQMQQLYAADFYWTDIDTNEQYVLMRPIHCMLLVGFDSDYYYFNDPLVGKAVKYPRHSSDIAYEAMFMQAIAIYPK